MADPSREPSPAAAVRGASDGPDAAAAAAAVAAAAAAAPPGVVPGVAAPPGGGAAPTDDDDAFAFLVQLHRVPCFRESVLYGGGGGALLGALHWQRTRTLFWWGLAAAPCGRVVVARVLLMGRGGGVRGEGVGQGDGEERLYVLVPGIFFFLSTSRHR